MKGLCVCFANVVVVASMPQRSLDCPLSLGLRWLKKEREGIMLRAWHIIVNPDEKNTPFSLKHCQPCPFQRNSWRKRSTLLSIQPFWLWLPSCIVCCTFGVLFIGCGFLHTLSVVLSASFSFTCAGPDHTLCVFEVTKDGWCKGMAQWSQCHLPHHCSFWTDASEGIPGVEYSEWPDGISCSTVLHLDLV